MARSVLQLRPRADLAAPTPAAASADRVSGRQRGGSHDRGETARADGHGVPVPRAYEGDPRQVPRARGARGLVADARPLPARPERLRRRDERARTPRGGAPPQLFLAMAALLPPRVDEAHGSDAAASPRR